ncbi:MAG: hypothetical protein KAH14_00855 [Clostridiales bacterium]|nr:hypothetical protein [Clostridiales bacterium]
MKYFKNTILVIIILLFVVNFTGCDEVGLGQDEILINDEIYQYFNNVDEDMFFDYISTDKIYIDIIYEFEAVVMYRNDGLNGYYEFYKKDNKIVEGRNVISTRNTEGDKYITFCGGTASGDYPFAVVFILDESFVDEKYTIELLGNKGRVTYQILQLAHAFETKLIGNIYGYKVYTSEGNTFLDITY